MGAGAMASRSSGQKWFLDSAPGEEVERLARRAISSRLARVARLLRASAAAEADPEQVHQLRVAARRAAAALDTFAEFCPSRRRAWMRKRLKQARRAAAEARDLDVMLARWSAPLADESPPTSLLLAAARSRRQAAQAQIVTAADQFDAKNFARRLAKLCDKLRPRGPSAEAAPTVSQWARRAIAPQAEAVFAAAAAQLCRPAALHALRICGKRLRYTLELFGNVAPAVLVDDVYPALVEMQDRLGEVNDHTVAQARLGDWLTDDPDGELAEALRRQLDQESSGQEAARSRFLAWWSGDRLAQFESRLRRGLTILEQDPPAAPPEAA